jgi:hypothetical protein
MKQITQWIALMAFTGLITGPAWAGEVLDPKKRWSFRPAPNVRRGRPGSLTTAWRDLTST